MSRLLLLALTACAPDIPIVCTPISGAIGTCSSISYCGPDPEMVTEPGWYDVAVYMEADGEAFLCTDYLCTGAMDEALAWCGMGY